MMYYFFYAALLFPSVIRSYLYDWKPNDKDGLNAKICFKNRLHRQSWYSIHLLWHPLYVSWHVIVLLQSKLSRKKQRKGKNVSSRLPEFPSNRSRVYKPALWILTQITLPTPTGMKTKPGEGIAARFVGGQEKPLLLPHNSCHWGGVAALTDGMCRPASADAR